jgi:hypothetical protein
MLRVKTYITVSSIDTQTAGNHEKPSTTTVTWIALVYLYASRAV